MPLLFLDFDGVCHPEPCHDLSQLFCKLPLLLPVLRRHPVDIVISSDWRSRRSVDELRAIFPTDIAQRIVGATPPWREVQDAHSFGRYVRQAEIDDWRKRHDRAWEAWVAIDDKPHLFKPFLPNLIVCASSTGLTEDTVQQLDEKLRLLRP